MGEIKSVKVDNWGVFFLQKLQNFFNKTDYCDLTLQFNDNSQLKVHRLVLSACTDYFNILEIQSDVADNTLLMPKDFQADVVVPIVNFMYTGTLEFEYNMYDKLFRTAREMNMTVLVKLLEAHRKSAPVPVPPRPVVLNKSIGQPRPVVTRSIPQTPPQTSFPQRANNITERTYASNKKTVVRPVKQPAPAQQKNVKYLSNFGKARTFKDNIPETIAIVSNYRQTEIGKKSGPSRFDPTEEEIIPDSFDTFNTISYESTPLMKAVEKDEDSEEYEGEYSASSSTFEQLRKGYTNPNKRPAPKMVAAPPAKKFNLQDVKEYTEAARLRKQLEADDDDENAFDYDADTHFDDEDEAISTVKSAKTSQNSSLKEQKSFDSSLITTKDDQIIVKDNSGSVHHAKIISEVLKKYPHLVKNNKNIKLKILQKNNSSPTSVSVQEPKPTVEIIKQEKISPTRNLIKVEKESIKPALQTVQQVKAVAPAPTPPTGPKKIDSKTMHALIAKGAENMTGPWLCLRCGVGKRPISIPSYKSFRRHLIQVHKEKIDPRICEHCGWKAIKKNDLVEHYLNKHNIKIKVETAIKNQPSTSKEGTTETSQKGIIQHCIYCNKTFLREIHLYSHMKSMHKEKAREDGVLDFSDDEQEFDDSDKYVPNAPNTGNSSQNEKIKILSNISLPPKGGMPFVIGTNMTQTISHLAKNSGQSSEKLVKLEPSSEAEALSNVASGIATSLGLVDSTVVMDESHYHNESAELLAEQYVHDGAALQNVIEQSGNENDIITKLVTTDGEELSQFQKEEIISQIQRQATITSENVVMVLNQEGYEDNEMLASNNQNIVVVYSQTENDDGTTTLTTVTSKTTTVAMQWEDSAEIQEIEKLRNEKEAKQKTVTTNKKGGQKSETEKKNEEEKLKLISALEGDWSEDEDEEPLPPAPKLVETCKNPPVKKDEGENLELIEKSLHEIDVVKAKEVSPIKERTPEEIMSELLGVDKMDEEIGELKDELEQEISKPTEDETDTPTKTTKESDVKELTNILGEWSSESFEEIKHDESEEVEVTIEDTSTQTNGAEDSSNSKIKDDEEEHEVTEISEIAEDIEDENSSTKPTLNTNNTSNTSVEPKEDIKTLINDWEDDDADL